VRFQSPLRNSNGMEAAREYRSAATSQVGDSTGSPSISVARRREQSNLSTELALELHAYVRATMTHEMIKVVAPATSG
jgi:hypothetical protein